MAVHYDIIIIGAGIAGSALAHALSLTRPQSHPPLKIALLERSLAQPDRIVGELLQPGGMHALKGLGLAECTEGIDAIPVHGYCVVYEGKQVEIPYPAGEEGRSFHHGAFVMRLREAASRARGVDVIEASVNELVEDPETGRVLGIRATRKATEQGPSVPETILAELTIAADGCHSKFRNTMGKGRRTPVTKSHFVGAILEDVELPMRHHGTVALVPGSGPVLMYQIGSRETRMLVDVKAPLPSDLKGYIRDTVVPALPISLHRSVLNALEKGRLRSMPNSFLPSTLQGQSGSKEGIFLIGDAWNMRHPLTGGGMTVALTDVFLLTNLLAKHLTYTKSMDDTPITVFIDWSLLTDVLHTWHWGRKGLSSTINILSVALYDLFGADDTDLHILREGCFKYFERGGESVNGPVSLLSGLAPSPSLLARHFFAVAFYSIYVLFTTPRPTSSSTTIGSKQKSRSPSIIDYPALFLRSISVIWTACVVFGPLVWSEVRWW